MSNIVAMVISGGAAGVINGLFGAGGGMILVPLLSGITDLKEDEIFPTSISIMLPMCIVSLSISGFRDGLPWDTALPYLIGSVFGGLVAGIGGRKIPTVWLHRGLGILILWGGIRYLW